MSSYTSHVEQGGYTVRDRWGARIDWTPWGTEHALLVAQLVGQGHTVTRI